MTFSQIIGFYKEGRNRYLPCTSAFVNPFKISSKSDPRGDPLSDPHQFFPNIKALSGEKVMTKKLNANKTEILCCLIKFFQQIL